MMKTIFRLFCGWMAIALTACTADDLPQVADTQNPNATRTVSVKAYTPDEQPESRLAFEEKQDGSLGVSWAEGDAFTAVIDNEKVTFTYDTEKNEFTAELPEGVTLADGVTAHYPAYTDEYSTDFSAQTGKLDSGVTYMEGTYSASTNSFRFSHSTAILKAAFSGLPDGAEVSSIEVKVNSYTIHIAYTNDLDLSIGIYIYLPAIAKDEEVVFDVTAAEVIYSATQTVTLNDGIKLGEVYNATIELSEVVCDLPKGSDFNNAIKSVPNFSNATSIVFEANSTETGGTQLGNSSAYAKVDGTTLKVYTAASKFVFNASCYLMFYELSGITSIAFGDNIDMSGVTDMSNMFRGCSSLESLDLSSFDTGNVKYMNSMFEDCSSLTSLDLSSFNTDNVTNMQFMFDGCSDLTSLTFGESFDTGNVTTMYQMFRNCSALTSLDLSSFDTGKVENMFGMFMGCSRLATLTLGENFDTGKVTTMNSMFNSCSSLTSLTLGENFNTGNVTNMSLMFNGCSRLESLNLSSFNTGNVTDMSYMFKNCSALTSLTLSENFDTGNVTTMYQMFNGCSDLTTLTLSENFDTGNVTNMNSMFDGCSSLESLDLSSFDTGNVTDMSLMFYDCLGLTTLTFGENFNTDNVTDMYSMFMKCASLTELDLSGFNTGKVENMGSMFYECSYLTELNLSSFSTEALTYCVDMFKNVPTTCAITISSAFKDQVADQLSDYSVTTVP